MQRSGLYYWMLYAWVLWAGWVAGAGAEPLSLETALDGALKDNWQLAAARAGVEEARAARLEARAGHLPRVVLSEGLTRTDDAVGAFGLKLRQEAFEQADFALDALNRPDAVTDFSTALEVQQPVFNGGQAIYGRRRAEAGLHQAEAQWRYAQAAVVLQTKEAYWGLVLARGQAVAVAAGLEAAQANLAEVEARWGEAASTRADVLAAQVRVQGLEAERIAAVQAVRDAQDGLGLVLGAEAGRDWEPTDTLDTVPLPEALEAWVGKALAARADLEALRFAEEGARQEVGLAGAAGLPRINAFARFQLNADAPFDRQGEGWTVGAQAEWALFSGGAVLGAKRRARAGLERVRAEGQWASQQAVQQVRMAHRGLEAARQRLAAVAKAEELAAEALRVRRLEYREELVSAAELLQAESEWTRARTQRLGALKELNVAQARLEFAAGLGPYSTAVNTGEGP